MNQVLKTNVALMYLVIKVALNGRKFHIVIFHSYTSKLQKSNLQMARDTAPLCTIIQAADGLSSALLED